MRGASALDELLAEFPDAPVRLHVIWEPVIVTDIAPPMTSILRLLDDPRVTQYWDPKLVVSNDIVRAVNADPARYGFEEPLPPGFVAWDVVAVFGRAERWEADLPVPAYYGGPVVGVVEETRRALAAELADGSIAGGYRSASSRRSTSSAPTASR